MNLQGGKKMDDHQSFLHKFRKKKRDKDGDDEKDGEILMLSTRQA